MAQVRYIKRILSGTALCLASVVGVQAGEDCSEDAMVVFDGSGSMAEVGFNLFNEPRIFEAQRAMQRAMPPVAAVRRLGLIIYGPGTGDECGNIDLRFGPILDAAPPIINAIDALQPDGKTPLTAAVLRAAEVLDYQVKPGTVVLVTDGKETCGGAPCALGEALAKDAADLTVHVIGFKVRGDYFDWNRTDGQGDFENTTAAECLATHTGGQYVSTETVDALVKALRDTLGCPLYGARTAPPAAPARP